VLIGVEVNGLEEFIMQPLRLEQLRRGTFVPVTGYRAPKGKLQFISSLQPFLQAGDITFAEDIAASSQFLSFPTGRIDFPNALAYALTLRPDVIYENFTMGNVAEDLRAQHGQPVYLCLNATKSVTTAVAVQFVGQGLHVLADWVREGEPGAIVADLIRDARLQIGKPLVLRAGPQHLERYDGVGLRAAVARVPADVQSGGSTDVGRAELRTLLQRHIRGEPASQASWTLKAFAAGYARNGVKLAMVGDDIYRVLIEGLESAVATGRIASEPDTVRYAVAPDGRRYMTASPHLAERSVPTKDRWWEEPAEPRTALPLGHPLRRR
jgi:hypothetical protein